MLGVYSSVGLIATDEEQVPSLVQEMASHYGHYVQTAGEFSKSWAYFHSPQLVLDTLLHRMPEDKRLRAA